jgi:hypothetical protein
MVHECFNCRSQFRKSLKLHRLIAAAVAKYLMSETSESPEKTPKFPVLTAHCYPEKEQPFRVKNFGVSLIQNYSVRT